MNPPITSLSDLRLMEFRALHEPALARDEVKHGLILNILAQAGGSKSTIYSEFGGKCGLFIRSIENLCRESNEPLTKIDYTGLNLEESLKELSFLILKLITANEPRNFIVSPSARQ